MNKETEKYRRELLKLKEKRNYTKLIRFALIISVPVFAILFIAIKFHLGLPETLTLFVVVLFIIAQISYAFDSEKDNLIAKEKSEESNNNYYDNDSFIFKHNNNEDFSTYYRTQDYYSDNSMSEDFRYGHGPETPLLSGRGLDDILSLRDE